MSDMPKGLKVTSMTRWVLFAGAGLLTVTTGFLVWIEVTDGVPSPARSFVWGTALALWIAGTLVSCTLLAVRLLTKRIDRAANKIMRTIALQRLNSLADLIDDSNVTSMYGRR